MINYFANNNIGKYKNYNTSSSSSYTSSSTSSSTMRSNISSSNSMSKGGIFGSGGVRERVILVVTNHPKVIKYIS